MENYERYLHQYDHYDDDYFYSGNAVLKYGELIGIFLMNFSSFEHDLDTNIADLINSRTHEMGYTIIEGLTVRNKIELFYRMFNKLAGANEKKAPKLKERLKAIRSSLNSINDFRNLIAHANWETVQKNGKIRVKFASDKESGLIIFKDVIIKPKDIRAKIKEIKKLPDKILYFGQDAYNALHQA